MVSSWFRQFCLRGRVPELPEVETVRRTLQRTIVGECIIGIDINWHRTLIDDAEPMRTRLLGACIIAIDRRAKLLLLRLDTGDSLTVHLRMTCQLLVSESGQPANPEH